MEAKTEIERKFLLRHQPNLLYDLINIRQYYIMDGDKPCRLRFSQSVGRFSGTLDNPTYEYIWKEKIGHGHNIEHIYDVTLQEADDLKKKAHRFLEKERYVYTYNGFKFEVDIIKDVYIVLMEVEVKYINEVIQFPKEIEDLILMEVTGNKVFDNYNLASNTI